MTEDDIEDFDEFIELFGNALDGTRQGAEGLDVRIRALAASTRPLNKEFKAVKKTSKDLGDEFARTLGAIGKGSSSFSDLNGIVDKVGGAFSDVVGMIPGIGGVLSGIGKAGTALLKYSIDLTDAGFKSWQDLADIGMSGRDGMTGLRKSIDEAQIPLSTFTKSVKDNSQGLSYAYGSVEKGAKVFSTQMGLLANSTNSGLRQIGLSTEQIAETSLKYQELNSRVGMTQIIDQQKLARETEKYAKELKVLSKLTGKSAETMMAEQEKQLDDARWASHLATLSPEEAAKKQKTAMMMSTIINPEVARMWQNSQTGAISGKLDEQRIIHGFTPVLNNLAAAMASGGDYGKETDALRAKFAGAASTYGHYGQVSAEAALELGDIAMFYRVGHKEAIAKIMADVKASIDAQFGKKDKYGQQQGSDEATTVFVKGQAKLDKISADMNSMFMGTKAAMQTVKITTDALAAASGTMKEILDKLTAPPSTGLDDARAAVAEDIEGTRNELVLANKKLEALKTQNADPELIAVQNKIVKMLEVAYGKQVKEKEHNANEKERNDLGNAHVWNSLDKLGNDFAEFSYKTFPKSVNDLFGNDDPAAYDEHRKKTDEVDRKQAERAAILKANEANTEKPEESMFESWFKTVQKIQNPLVTLFEWSKDNAVDNMEVPVGEIPPHETIIKPPEKGPTWWSDPIEKFKQTIQETRGPDSGFTQGASPPAPAVVTGGGFGGGDTDTAFTGGGFGGGPPPANANTAPPPAKVATPAEQPNNKKPNTPIGQEDSTESDRTTAAVSAKQQLQWQQSQTDGMNKLYNGINEMVASLDKNNRLTDKLVKGTIETNTALHESNSLVAEGNLIQQNIG